MENILPIYPAKDKCIELMAELENKKTVVEGDDLFSTDYLFSRETGQMFGVLICEDVSGNMVELKAFSGQYSGVWNVPGWVPAVLDVEKFNMLVFEIDSKIKELTDKIDNKVGDIVALKEERKSISEKSIQKIFSFYEIYTINRTIISLSDCFPDKKIPGGAGDCCTIKLLNFAFKNGLHPISLAEFFYGNSNRSNTKKSKQFYFPCEDKCRPILKQMLGIDIVYLDSDIIVVNKQDGVLTTHGKGDKTDCIVSRVQKIFRLNFNLAVHRLDMDTSGLLVLALNKESHRDLSIQFMERVVEKKYLAVVDGEVEADNGKIELSFRVDLENRPYQIIDNENGKVGISLWKKIKTAKGRTLIEWQPITGRTHQLRLHSAYGLNAPIVGDRLYGKNEKNERMLLHAFYLSFRHPVSGQKMEFMDKIEW